jgi:cytochrome c oxidase subunit 1
MAVTARPGALAAPSLYAGGLWSWLTTVDHKRIAILYGVTGFVFLLIGGLQAVVMRAQLAVPNNTLVSAQTFNELFTMHGTTLVFLATMPLNAAFFNYMVPLMIGARDVAFPRLNAFSFWAALAGGLVLNFSWFAGVAPDMGWFAYANLTSPQFSPTKSVDYWIVGLVLAGVGSLAAGLNFIVTIINMRAPGMRLMRMPPFAWMTLIMNILFAIAFPPIAVGIFFLMFDRFFGTHFYIPAGGGDPVLWQHLFWVFGHPEVYILILPAMGIVSEILPAFARKPLFGYPFVVYSGITIAVLGFGVWAHHMFSIGMGPLADSIFAIATMLIAIPTGVKIFNWLATLWGGSINMKTPLLYAAGFIAMFTMGGLTGIMNASPPADLQATDTYFVVGHFHYTLFGGLVLAQLGGIHYWFPKITGRMMDDRLGKVAFWLILIAFNVTFLPMHAMGLLGMPRRVYTYHPGLGLDGLNLVSTLGTYLLTIGFLVFTWNLVKSLRRGEPAPANPWDAPTLEWAVSSPPPPYNFATIPPVHSRYPLWEEHQAAGPRPSSVAEGEGHGIHMPNPSIWPASVALGLLIMGSGALAGSLAALGVGVVVLLGSIYAWAFQPAS